MSLGANFSSGHTQNLIDNSVICSVPIRALEDCSPCSNKPPGPTAVYPSMLLKGKVCPPPTPEDFAKYPKVAVPSSVRTQSMMTKEKCTDISQRFAQFRRYQVPVPCIPLPPSMAGISQPSTRACNL
jgi:hypothetical protein